MSIHELAQNQVVYSTEQSRKAGVCVCWHLRNAVGICLKAVGHLEILKLSAPQARYKPFCPCVVFEADPSKKKVHHVSGLPGGSGHMRPCETLYVKNKNRAKSAMFVHEMPKLFPTWSLPYVYPPIFSTPGTHTPSSSYIIIL